MRVIPKFTKSEHCAVMNPLQARHVQQLEITIYKYMIIEHYIAGADDAIAWSQPLCIVHSIQETKMVNIQT